MVDQTLEYGKVYPVSFGLDEEEYEAVYIGKVDGKQVIVSRKNKEICCHRFNSSGLDLGVLCLNDRENVPLSESEKEKAVELAKNRSLKC